MGAEVLNLLAQIESFTYDNSHTCHILSYLMHSFYLFYDFLYIVAFTQNVCGTEWHFMCSCAIKGEINPKIKLDLNDSFCPLINKYKPHIF